MEATSSTAEQTTSGDAPGPSSTSDSAPGPSCTTHDAPGPSTIASGDAPGPSSIASGDAPGPSSIASGDAPGPSGLSGDGEEEEETDLKLAWEMLELARVICQKYVFVVSV